MTGSQFQTLSVGLRQIAADIPLSWGRIQNNQYDAELENVCNIFEVMSLPELESFISQFDNAHKMYYKRRWYSVRLADCDEYLFYKHRNVEHNPNPFDKVWDIKINGMLCFDIKSTRIPVNSDFVFPSALKDTQRLIEWYYDNQSNGVRYSMNNRLFLVHHSIYSPGREVLLRCAWGTKNVVFSRFVQNASQIHFHSYQGYTAGIIFLVETERNVLNYYIDGLDTELQTVR